MNDWDSVKFQLQNGLHNFPIQSSHLLIKNDKFYIFSSAIRKIPTLHLMTTLQLPHKVPLGPIFVIIMYFPWNDATIGAQQLLSKEPCAQLLKLTSAD